MNDLVLTIIAIYVAINILSIYLAVKIILVLKRTYNLYEYNTDKDDFIVDMYVGEKKTTILRYGRFNNRTYNTYLVTKKNGNILHYSDGVTYDTYEITPIDCILMDHTIQIRVVSHDYHISDHITCETNLTSPGFLYIVGSNRQFDQLLTVYYDKNLGRMRTEIIDINSFMHEIAEYVQTNYKYHLRYGTCIYSKENLQLAIEAKRKSNYNVRFFNRVFNLRRDQYDR